MSSVYEKILGDLQSQNKEIAEQLILLNSNYTKLASYVVALYKMHKALRDEFDLLTTDEDE